MSVARQFAELNKNPQPKRRRRTQGNATAIAANEAEEDLRPLPLSKRLAQDPRYGDLYFLTNPELKEEVWGHVLAEWALVSADETPDEDSKQLAEAGLMTLRRHCEANSKTYRLQQGPANPLDWWKSNKLAQNLKVLHPLVRSLLCIVAAETPCERLFSSGAYVVDKRRATLAPETVEYSLVIRDFIQRHNNAGDLFVDILRKNAQLFQQ